VIIASAGWALVHPQPDEIMPPTGSFSMTEKFSPTQQKVQFGVIVPEIKVADVKITVSRGGATWYSATLGTGNVTLTQLNGSANKVASDDYILITPNAVGGAGEYEVAMIYIPTGNFIGAAITFNW
jgi:hypothetical protein